MSRRRKAGEREPNGRLKRISAEESKFEAMRHVLEKRCHDLGWRPTFDNLKKVQGQEGGTKWGVLFLLGKITEPQKNAASWFSELHADYLRSIDAPKPFAASGSDMPRGPSETPEEWAQRKRAEYTSLEAQLRRSLSRRNLGALKGLCCYDVDQRVEDLLPGLDLLVQIGVDGNSVAA